MKAIIVAWIVAGALLAAAVAVLAKDLAVLWETKAVLEETQSVMIEDKAVLQEDLDVVVAFKSNALMLLERLATAEAMYQAWRADKADRFLVPGSLMTPDGEELPIHFRAWYGKVEMPDGSDAP